MQEFVMKLRKLMKKYCPNCKLKIQLPSFVSEDTLNKMKMLSKETQEILLKSFQQLEKKLSEINLYCCLNCIFLRDEESAYCEKLGDYVDNPETHVCDDFICKKFIYYLLLPEVFKKDLEDANCRVLRELQGEEK